MPISALIMMASLAAAQQPAPVLRPIKPVKPLVPPLAKPTPVPKAQMARPLPNALQPQTRPVLPRLGERPKLSPAVGEALRKRQEEARIQKEKDRKLGICNATGGRWIAKVKGISLSASGSDVDEIYGKISVGDISNATFSSSFRSTRQDWGNHEIWASKDNFNLGRDKPNLSTVTISSTTPISAIRVNMSLYDEDDGRGGSNDEFFYLENNTSIYTNSRSFDVYVPPCWQSPEFSQVAQVQMIGRPMGSASSNRVTLFVRVEISRVYS